MKADKNDPWRELGHLTEPYDHFFEDAFVEKKNDDSRLPDSDQYLERLYSRLQALQKGSSKQDLVSSLTIAKEDCIARLINERRYLESEKETELVANPVIKLVAPHLQALTTNELVHLLKADFLQEATIQQYSESEVNCINGDTKNEMNAKENANEDTKVVIIEKANVVESVDMD